MEPAIFARGSNTVRYTMSVTKLAAGPSQSMPTVSAPPNATVPLSHSHLSSSGSVLHVYLPPPSAAHPFRAPLAVVIVPGGSYRPGPFNWCKSAEGSDVAMWLVREVGVIASVLHYRMPAGRPEPPLEDLAEAIDLMRRGWVPPHRWSPPLVAVMGFSAGGHLAAMAATAARMDILMLSARERSQRPDMALLLYPLISMSDPNCTHANSQREFLGRAPTLELRQRYSAELRLSNATPPTLLVHARDDAVVPLRGRCGSIPILPHSPQAHTRASATPLTIMCGRPAVPSRVPARCICRRADGRACSAHWSSSRAAATPL